MYFCNKNLGFFKINYVNSCSTPEDMAALNSQGDIVGFIVIVVEQRSQTKAVD